MWYMKSINLPESIQDRVRLWFNYNWEQQKTLGKLKVSQKEILELNMMGAMETELRALVINEYCYNVRGDSLLFVGLC